MLEEVEGRLVVRKLVGVVRKVPAGSCSSLVGEGSGARAEAVGRGHTGVLGRVVGRVVVGSKGQQDTHEAVGNEAQDVGSGARVVGSEAQVVGNGVPVGNEALGKAAGMQGKARDKALAEVERGSARAEVQDREHNEAQGRAGGREGRQAGQGSEEEGKKALDEVLGLVQPQVQQGQLVVAVGTQVERKVVEWVVQSSVEEEEDRRG